MGPQAKAHDPGAASRTVKSDDAVFVARDETHVAESIEARRSPPSVLPHGTSIVMTRASGAPTQVLTRTRAPATLRDRAGLKSGGTRVEERLSRFQPPAPALHRRIMRFTR